MRLTHDCIAAAELVSLVAHAGCGGIVSFEGIVRAEKSTSGSLEALEYSAYDEMALRWLDRIRAESLAKFEIHEAAIAHRLGRLAIGECSVAIVVAAAHRAAAFEACRHIIESIKKDVPIWKKELWSGGETRWTEPPTDRNANTSG